MAKTSFWVSICLTIAAFVVLQNINIGEDVVVTQTGIEKIPRTIDELSATDVALDDAVVKELDPDAYLFRNYQSSHGRIINVYIGYYGTSKGGKSTHNPDACYPGAGWSILSEEVAELLVEHEGAQRRIRLNLMRVKKGDNVQLVYHWYQTMRDTVITSGFQQNINRFRNMLVYHRNDGAFIRVSSSIGESEVDTKRAIERFIRQLYPLLVEYWPQEEG